MNWTPYYTISLWLTMFIWGNVCDLWIHGKYGHDRAVNATAAAVFAIVWGLSK